MGNQMVGERGWLRGEDMGQEKEGVQLVEMDLTNEEVDIEVDYELSSVSWLL